MQLAATCRSRAAAHLSVGQKRDDCRSAAPNMKRALVAFCILILALFAFVTGSQYERYSHRFMPAAEQLGVIREKREAEMTVYKRIHDGAQRFPDRGSLIFEWKSQSFLQYLFSFNTYEQDNASVVIFYNPADRRLELETPLDRVYDWSGVLPSHIERAVKEGIPIEDFGKLGCKSNLPG